MWRSLRGPYYALHRGTCTCTCYMYFYMYMYMQANLNRMQQQHTTTALSRSPPRLSDGLAARGALRRRRTKSRAEHMNKDRQVLEQLLQDKDSRGRRLRLPGSDSTPVWDRLSKRDHVMIRANSLEALKGCPLPANYHRHAAEYGRTAHEASAIGCVPPLPAKITKMLSYHDPGGAATKTHLEALTLNMINNHDANDKAWAAEDRAEQNRHTDARVF